MKKKILKENQVKFYSSAGKISKKLPVFYNPAMKLNRNISTYLLNSLPHKNMQIALPLAASGIRGIRFLQELKKNKIIKIYLNDENPKAIQLIKENLRLNNLEKNKNISLSQTDANLFLLQSKGFDYIDIDPFGSPNPFLNNASIRLARKGILAVTATDTSALTGTYKKACRRKYWAEPLKDSNMHETGLRILIRKCQLMAAQFDKALTPVYSYFKGHYFRIFFSCRKGKKRVDKIIKQHGFYKTAGPLWLGQLWDKKLAQKISQQDKKNKFLQIIKEESKIDSVGFYHLPSLAKKNKTTIKKEEKVIRKIKSKGYQVSKTHFAPNSLRSDIPKKEINKIIAKE